MYFLSVKDVELLLQQKEELQRLQSKSQVIPDDNLIQKRNLNSTMGRSVNKL